MKMTTKTIERAALGTVARIGDLYDARSDNFSKVSIFKEVPQVVVTRTECFSIDANTVEGDSYSGKFSKLGVDTDQQVSLLVGLAPQTDSIKYILDKTATTGTLTRSCIYRINTKDERLSTDGKDVVQSFSKELFESTVATHVVTGISWGSNLVLSLSVENTSEDAVEKIEEYLVSKLKEASLAISNTTSSNINEPESSKIDRLELKIYGDLIPNIEESVSGLDVAIQRIRQLSDLVIKSNESKCQPLKYHLAPLNHFMDQCNFPIDNNVAYTELNSTTNIRLVQVFNKSASMQEQLNACNLFGYCVAEKDKQNVNILLKDMESHKRNFKPKLASLLEKVRSGKLDITELESLITEFEKCSLLKPTEFLDNQKSLFAKINFSRLLVSKGVKYIGIGSAIDDEIKRHLNQKIFVLYFTQDSYIQNAERWLENKRLFLEHFEKKSKNEQYFAVDCDIHPNLMPSTYKNSSCIQVLQSGLVITEDLLEENSQIQVIARARATEMTEKFAHLPNKHVTLAIPCVGINCNRQTIHSWACKTCGEIFQYGFDFYVYCLCGKSFVSGLEFKCPDIKHGPQFQMQTDSSYLDHLLEQLQPPKDINILILGETGVGKSTWINGFINYLTYESIEEAQSGKLVTLIPSEFTVCNPTPTGFEQIVVRTGHDKNEVFTSGQSATQTTKVYPIPFGDTTVRLIDTPGIGDTRGIEQDKKNFQNILTTLSHLEELHGICILLKPNSARLTVMFRFCIKELLTYLHRDASKNIVFAFTNSRSTLYKPGDTFPALNTLLKENKEVEIIVSPSTVYCYDSEAYRFLAAMKNDPPVAFDDGEKENFAKSWERSIIETKRMLKYINSLEPHPIRDTMNLNNAREMVLKLTRPLAEISRNIQTNKANLNHEMDEIEKTDENISKLKKKKFTTITEIQSQPVDHPKTVCAHGNCVKVWKHGSFNTNEYVQVCHEKCQLKDVQRDSLGDPGLMQCAALHQSGGQRCCVCGHDYKIHLHVYYDSIQVPKLVEDQAVKEALKNNLDAKQMKKNMISLRKKKIDKFEAEQKQIEKASAKFAYFLRINAITPYNDELEQYLFHLIREEKDKVAQGGDLKALECLESSMSSYLEEKRILETEMSKEGGDGEGLSPKEIEQIVEKLKGLELTGTSLKEALECVEKTRLTVYHEEVISSRKEFFGSMEGTRGFWEKSKTKAKKIWTVWFS